MFGFSSKKVEVTPERQQELKEKSLGLALYHYTSCPFCVRVRRFMAQEGLDIEERDILEKTHWRQDLLQGGGKTQVPCLRIEGERGDVRWLYESADIVQYLKDRLDLD